MIPQSNPQSSYQILEALYVWEGCVRSTHCTRETSSSGDTIRCDAQPSTLAAARVKHPEQIAVTAVTVSDEISLCVAPSKVGWEVDNGWLRCCDDRCRPSTATIRGYAGRQDAGRRTQGAPRKDTHTRSPTLCCAVELWYRTHGISRTGPDCPSCPRTGIAPLHLRQPQGASLPSQVNETPFFTSLDHRPLPARSSWSRPSPEITPAIIWNLAVARC